jgi:hypothetical protein
MTKRARRLAAEVVARQLIQDLHIVLRGAAAMDEFRTIKDPRLAEGFDFSYWADECEKVLRLPEQAPPSARRERLPVRCFRIALGEGEEVGQSQSSHTEL